MHSNVLSLTITNDVDLNYRMDIPDQEMRKTLRDNGWENGPKFETLLRFDQVSLSYIPGPTRIFLTHPPSLRKLFKAKGLLKDSRRLLSLICRMYLSI